MRGKDIVVLGIEKKAVAKLQEDRTVRKIALLDDHVAMAFAGMFRISHSSTQYELVNDLLCIILHKKLSW